MEGLLNADPGLRRRFPRRLHLQDYDGEALAQIGNKTAKERFQVEFVDGVQVVSVAWLCCAALGCVYS